MKLDTTDATQSIALWRPPQQPAVVSAGTWIIALLDHENATTKTECVKMLYPVLYDYSYFREEYFWGKHTKITF